MVETDKEKNIWLLSKFLRRLYRGLAKSIFPNSLRIFLLRKAGVKIGGKVVVNEGFTLACDVGYEENLIIEDQVAIGPNTIVVLTSNPNFSKLREQKEIYPSLEVIGKVHIRNDAWIGAGCIILPNVTIGEFSIVGAGAVVTKDVLPFTLVAGVPAKVIKKLDVDSVKWQYRG